MVIYKLYLGSLAFKRQTLAFSNKPRAVDYHYIK